MEEKRVTLHMLLHVQDDHFEKKIETAYFLPKIDHRMAPRRRGRLIEHPFAIIS